MAKRYDQMFAIIDEVRPTTIVEVGVHGAIRASKLSERALKWNPLVRYVGYDVFETLGLEYQAEALNGKGMALEADARRKLKSLADCHDGFEFHLVVGDTRDTLHGKKVAAEFAFIDGDHRVEAIRGDAAALDCPVMVFDDYYVEGPGGELVDPTRYGANAVVDEYQRRGYRVEILPQADRCDHGSYAKLAVVRK